MKNETTINIIPDDYNGNPQSAMGYCWKNYEDKVQGDDVVVTRTADGIDYRAIAAEKMADLGIDSAYVNCMWAGGFSGKLPASNDKREIAPPITAEETAVADRRNDEIILAEINFKNHTHLGWCDNCHSYCYGDCQA